MLLNAVVVFSVPLSPPLIAHALVPLVAARVSPPPPPSIEPVNEATPLLSVKVSAAVPPTSASMLVAFIPSTVTALLPVIVQPVAPFGPVIVSLPVPPVNVSMLVNVVVVLRVPWFAAVTVHALTAFAPAMVLILKRFFDQIPVELEDAARVDGANRLRVFWSIVLPLSRPILAAVAIFVFIGAWNNFLWPFIVTTDADLMTLPVGLQTVKSAYGLQYAQNMASAILAALPLVLVFLFFQRQIIKGIATTGFGGQ